MTYAELIANGWIKRADGNWDSPHRATSRAPSRAEPQCPVLDEPVATPPREDCHPASRLVSIVSFRHGRLLDPDNLTGKYFLDSIRYAGLIPDDSSREIQYSIRQIQVATPAEERTEITISPL